jgi:hypothetical protein
MLLLFSGARANKSVHITVNGVVGLGYFTDKSLKNMQHGDTRDFSGRKFISESGFIHKSVKNMVNHGDIRKPSCGVSWNHHALANGYGWILRIQRLDWPWMPT